MCDVIPNGFISNNLQDGDEKWMHNILSGQE